MDRSQQQFLEEWNAFLQQSTAQVTRTLQEADGGCRQLIAAHASDAMPTLNAIRAVGLQISEIRTRIGTHFSSAMLSKLMGSLDNRQVIEQGTFQLDSADQWISETWDKFKVHFTSEAVKAMWPAVSAAMTRTPPCSKCGAPLTLTTPNKSESIGCRSCGAVNQVTPDPVVGTYYSLAPDAWAEQATLDQLIAIQRFRREVEAQRRHQQNTQGSRGDEPIESLQRWESMEKDRWVAYFAAKAQVLPQSAEDQQKMVESRMKPFYDDLKHNPVWARAHGVEEKIMPLAIPSHLADVDEWGPLRHDLVEEFEFQQFLLEESRQEPPQFREFLKKFGYADQLTYERVRRTFHRHFGMYAGDQNFMAMQLRARNRASDEQLAAKRAASSDILSPIDGVSLDQYAAMSAKQASGMAIADFQALLAQSGLDQARWDTVSAAWMDRMSRDTDGVISAAYAKAFASGGAGQFGAAAQAGAAATGASGLPNGAAQGPEPVSFERYCEIMGAQNAWARTGKDVNAMLKSVFNMSALDYSSLSSFWMGKIMTDPSMSMQMVELMQKYEQKYL